MKTSLYPGPERRTIASFMLPRALFLALLVLLALLFVSRASVLASSFTVNSTADAVDANIGDGICETTAQGECTLRAAVQEANVSEGEDDITLPAGTYILTLSGDGENGGATGDLDHFSSSGRLIITGAGSGVTTISAAGLGDRLFDIANSTLALTGVTLTGGNVSGSGGAIGLVEAGAELRDVIVTGNSASVNGGGISVSGQSLYRQQHGQQQSGRSHGRRPLLELRRCHYREILAVEQHGVGAGSGLGLVGGSSNVTLLDSSIADNINFGTAVS